MDEIENQARFRLVGANGDLIDVPRRYPQSTSGRVSSTGTSPPLSRSSEIDVDSAIRCFVDMALRRYPTEVSQRAAKSSWADLSRELRYVRSASMPGSLLNSKIVSIPFGNLPSGNRGYDFRMDRKRLKELRFKNFDELMLRYENSPKRFCAETGYGSPTVISQLKNRQRAFGADMARELERVAGLEKYALESESGLDGKNKAIRAYQEPANWPFSVSLSEFMALGGKTRGEIDETLTKLVIGAQAQHLLAKQRKQTKQS